MSEKGGKPNGKASSLKGKGKSVHFSPQVSNSDKSAPAPAPATPSASASTKGGKGKGGSGPSKKEEPLVLEMDGLKNAKCLMDCEVLDIFKEISDNLTVLSYDRTIKSTESFAAGLKYAQRANQYTNAISVRKVIENLKQFGVSDGEMCLIAKICPETADEVFALVPSLKDRRIILNEPVNDVVSELAKLKRSS